MLNPSYRSTSFPAVVVVVDVVFVICCFFSPSFLSQLYIYLLQVSLINFVASLAGAGGIQAFKTMRTLRALRPLRAMSRMQGMRVCTQQSQGTLEEHDDITYKSAIGHHVRIDPLNLLLIVALFYYFGGS